LGKKTVIGGKWQVASITLAACHLCCQEINAFLAASGLSGLGWYKDCDGQSLPGQLLNNLKSLF
jgi:hypothetical protein